MNLPRSLMVIAACFGTGACPAATQYVYEHQGIVYPYSIESTGDNYTFEFEKNPGRESGQLQAARHVLHSVYADDSIETKYSEVFLKEGAKCYVFEARFDSYRTCFLPNDYSPDHRERFWGFVSQLHNGWWFLTRQGLPAALVLAGVAFAFRGQNR